MNLHFEVWFCKHDAAHYYKLVLNLVTLLPSTEFTKPREFSYCLWEVLNLNKYNWSRTHFAAKLPQFYFISVISVKVQCYVYESLHNFLTPNPEILRFSLDLTNHHSFHSYSWTFKHYKGVLWTSKVEKMNENNPILSKK